MPDMKSAIVRPARRVELLPEGLSLCVRPFRIAKLMKLFDASSVVMVA